MNIEREAIADQDVHQVVERAAGYPHAGAKPYLIEKVV